METLCANDGSDLKPALLITGASGLLGHPLCRLAREQWRVHAVYRNNIPQLDGLVAIQRDLTETSCPEELLDTVRPQAVIHAAAAAQVAECQAHSQQTERINVAVPARLAQLCADRRIPLVHISSDLVFDGTRAPYDEQAQPAPFCVYSDQKVRAEKAVLKNHSTALICRLPLLFGWAPHIRNNFSVQMLTAIAHGRPLRLFADEYRTPVDTVSAAQGILTVLGRAQGLLHLGGQTRISRYDLGLMMAAAMQATTEMIVAASIWDGDLPYKRASDCSLVSQRAYALGYHPAALELAVQQTVACYRNLYNPM
ncbi:MAG: sugar nucleotide-binding protein [Desulfobacteraceae bacterium]|nr:sugar nucleotide-binding protein [Desulfobacteraceae bacterium]